MFKADNNEVVGIDSNKTNKIEVNLSKNNKSKKSTYIPSIGITKQLIFLIPNVKKTFNHIKKIFIKALIF